MYHILASQRQAQFGTCQAFHHYGFELARMGGVVKLALAVLGTVQGFDQNGGRRFGAIQGAQHILHTMTWLDRWPDADERSRIVFIAQGTTRAELKEIIGMLDRMSARTFKAREKGRLAREQAEKAAGGTDA